MFRSLLPLVLLTTGCQTLHSPLPLGMAPTAAADVTFAWVGTGTGYLWEDGAWVRSPANDYEFTVVQRRYADRWASVKQLHRYREDYTGAAGARDQLWQFELGLKAAPSSGVVLEARTSLGDGAGTSDVAFGEASLELAAPVPAAAPFSHYRITQHYDYAAGTLTEEVLLFERTSAGDQPYFRSDEVARLLAPTTFATPPTIWR